MVCRTSKRASWAVLFVAGIDRVLILRERLDVLGKRLDFLELELVLEAWHRRLAIHDLRHDPRERLARSGEFGAVGLFHAVTLVAPAAFGGKKFLDVATEFFVDLGSGLIGRVLGKAGHGKQAGDQRNGEDGMRTA